MLIAGFNAQKATGYWEKNFPHRPFIRLILATTIDITAINPFAVPESKVLPEVASFAELLESREYDRAIAHYETAVQLGEGNQALLKPEFVEYLRARVQGCADGFFVDLVDLWLDAYYADIEILLLLAENQRICSSPEEAARTLQMANTYTVNRGNWKAQPSPWLVWLLQRIST